jgi:hypothetical protein
MGFLGVLEDKHLQHVPATVILKEQSSLPSAEGAAALKHGTGKNADIVLIPQPYGLLSIQQGHIYSR